MVDNFKPGAQPLNVPSYPQFITYLSVNFVKLR